MWPRDVGVTLEEDNAVSKSFKFLHTVLVFDDKTSEIGVSVLPASSNSDFARGDAPHPAASKLLPYVGAGALAKAPLRDFLLCKLSTISRVLLGSVALAISPTADLLAEIFQLGWPASDVARTMRGCPVRDKTGFAMLVRSSGKVLQHLQVCRWESREIYPRVHNVLLRAAKRLDSVSGLCLPSAFLPDPLAVR